MLNLLIINHASRISGAERVLERMISLFDRTAINPIMVCPKGDLAIRLHESGIRVITMPLAPLERTIHPLRLIKYLHNFIRVHRSLLRVFNTENIDLIHCNSFTATLYSMLAARKKGIPLLWHMHDILKYRRINRMFIKTAGRFSTKIICVSQAVMKNLTAFGVDRNRCEVIYNSIPNLSRRKIASFGIRTELGIPTNAPLVAMIGQIGKWKGQEVFIDACSKLVNNCDLDAVRCIIVGDTISPAEHRYKERIIRNVKENNLSTKIFFTGFRTDVEAIISEADIIVHASILPDPLPTVIMEAMNSGKAVVATDVGGVPELVTHRKNGLIVPPADPDALSKAIALLIAHPELRDQMGKEGRTAANMKFNIRQNLVKLMNLYNDFLPLEKRIPLGTVESALN